MAKILVFLIFGLLGFVDAIENDKILKDLVDDLIRIGKDINVVNLPNVPCQDKNNYGYLIEQLYQTGFILNKKYPTIFVLLIDSVDQKTLQKFIEVVFQTMKEAVRFGEKCIALSTYDVVRISSHMYSIPDYYFEIDYSISFPFNFSNSLLLPLIGGNYIKRSIFLYSLLLGLCGDTDAPRRLKDVSIKTKNKKNKKKMQFSLVYYAELNSWNLLARSINSMNVRKTIERDLSEHSSNSNSQLDDVRNYLLGDNSLNKELPNLSENEELSNPSKNEDLSNPSGNKELSNCCKNKEPPNFSNDKIEKIRSDTGENNILIDELQNIFNDEELTSLLNGEKPKKTLNDEQHNLFNDQNPHNFFNNKKPHNIYDRKPHHQSYNSERNILNEEFQDIFNVKELNVFIDEERRNSST